MRAPIHITIAVANASLTLWFCDKEQDEPGGGVVWIDPPWLVIPSGPAAETEPAGCWRTLPSPPGPPPPARCSLVGHVLEHTPSSGIARTRDSPCRTTLPQDARSDFFSSLLAECGPTELCVRRFDECETDLDLAACEDRYDQPTLWADMEACVACDCDYEGQATCDGYLACGEIGSAAQC